MQSPVITSDTKLDALVHSCGESTGVSKALDLGGYAIESDAHASHGKTKMQLIKYGSDCGPWG
jgi:hypothetical protein